MMHMTKSRRAYAEGRYSVPRTAARGLVLALVCGMALSGCGDESGGGSWDGPPNYPSNDPPGYVPDLSGEDGVYVGLISFAGGVTDLNNVYGYDYYDGGGYYNDGKNGAGGNGGGTGRLVYLDSSGKSNLQSSLYGYNMAHESGTALFYAVHKALANLTANAPGFPANIESVIMLTFTDGLDNASFGASNANPIDGKSGVASGAYATYVKEQIGSRTFKGKPVTAYSVGVMGTDVSDEDAFKQNLENIASKPENVTVLDNFDGLQTVFNEIADGLTVSVEQSLNFSMTTTGNDPGTIIRMTFDVSGNTPAEAAASTRYIEGTLAYNNNAYSLTNITYNGITSTSGATIQGTTTGSGALFEFKDITGYTPGSDTPKQWTKSSGANSWSINSEYSAVGATETTTKKSTAIVYMVLDASTSLNNDQVSQIRNAASGFIDKLYAKSNVDTENDPYGYY